MKRLRGIHINHFKGTENCEAITVKVPQKVLIPMSMNMGVPCTPTVKPGDTVLKGQLIGDCDAPFSVPVHASISGKVKSIQEYLTAMGSKCKAVEIEADEEQQMCPDIKPPVITDKESFIKAVRAAGTCGLGGAGFPTHIKMNSKTPIDTLVINAAECEPYITSDYRQMIEAPDEVIGGIKLIMKHIAIKSCKIGIEDNKPEAIKLLTEKLSSDNNIEVVTLPSGYPQGAEKILIYNTTGRIVKEGALPSDEGVMVVNVSTAAFIYRYSLDGIPLIERRVTIDGDTVKKPCNVMVPIGISIAELLKFAECETDKVKKLISGGPMMGMCLYTEDSPITKTTSAVLAMSKVEEHKETACIRCGACINACPMNLMPTDLERAYKTKDVKSLLDLKLMLCMNCGSCSYVCPANRKLAEANQLAKSLIPRKK